MSIFLYRDLGWNSSLTLKIEVDNTILFTVSVSPTCNWLPQWRSLEVRTFSSLDSSCTDEFLGSMLVPKFIPSTLSSCPSGMNFRSG